VLDSELANKTLTYAGREVTLVLDFDDKGFLISVEPPPRALAAIGIGSVIDLSLIGAIDSSPT
jgi:hypothetical protein